MKPSALPSYSARLVLASCSPAGSCWGGRRPIGRVPKLGQGFSGGGGHQSVPFLARQQQVERLGG
ncbi:MAG: hypothetical protein ACJ06V_11180, partial [Verrucomicrobiota bacterium]